MIQRSLCSTRMLNVLKGEARNLWREGRRTMEAGHAAPCGGALHPPFSGRRRRGPPRRGDSPEPAPESQPLPPLSGVAWLHARPRRRSPDEGVLLPGSRASFQGQKDDQEAGSGVRNRALGATPCFPRVQIEKGARPVQVYHAAGLFSWHRTDHLQFTL